jgi:hypothetical protein
VSTTTGVPWELLEDMSETMFAAVEKRAMMLIEARSGKK